MKNKCIISFIKRVECNYSEETHEKSGKDCKRMHCMHSLRGSALHTWPRRAWSTAFCIANLPRDHTQCSYAFLLRTFCTPVHVSEKIKSAHVTHFSASDWLHPWTRFIMFCELQYFFGDLVITKMSYYFRQHCCISGFHFLTIRSWFHSNLHQISSDCKYSTISLIYRIVACIRRTRVRRTPNFW